ncbi:MAG TPA: IS110 family transposase [Acidobacteriaceae bacterium]|nr:IS110 family transposase [Acidobacteriaceae bacterium]
MKIVGCDFHPSHQQVAIFDSETGEIQEKKLNHANGEAEKFYRELKEPVLIGMEATGNSRWFELLVLGLGHELWIGDAAEIRASYVRKQKTDKRDAGHILKLLMEKRFPKLWVPDQQQRDIRQLLTHRHKLVSVRTRLKTELQHLALNHGVQKKRQLWNREGRKLLLSLPLEGWSRQRRSDLLHLLAVVEPQIEQLDKAVEQAARANPQAVLLMSQPGVGPITSLAFVVTLGEVSRFERSNQVSSYLGLIPSERSSGNQRRLGGLSKQGNVFLRTLLVEAAQSAVKHDPGFRKEYLHRCHHKAKGIAKVAAARKLAVRLYWMLKSNKPYPEVLLNGGSPRHPVAGKENAGHLNGHPRIAH